MLGMANSLNVATAGGDRAARAGAAGGACGADPDAGEAAAAPASDRLTRSRAHR